MTKAADVSYDDVSRVAGAMRDKGIEPTNRLVLQETGGSATTVHKHFKNWRDSHPKAAAPPPELPAPLLKALQDELRKQQGEARSEVEGRLAAALIDAADMLRAAEQAEGALQEAESAIQTLTTEKDELAGRTAELQKELLRVQQLLEGEKRENQQLRIDVAHAQLRGQSDAELVKTLRDEVGRLSLAIDNERTGRVAAERDKAAALAGSDALQEHVRDLQGRLSLSERARESAAALIDNERAGKAEADRGRAAAEERAAAATQRAEDLARREENLRTELLETRAELKTRSAPAGERPNASGA